ncbi:MULTISPECIES: hypothetical protein [unclassified Streptomyces]|uniref:hypothetical protein n=1 Tax=unclassified Streptomyces TaxID=2593676 RepID=UPI001F17A6F0|nr:MULTISPECIES: hypothetical protein [unclassified Streptomyces]MCF0086673.1 hypothetical protein [Streptomyces sp. MH192]MCF0098827.1 hypothetical protein [Streptomyces sp. MH191]
MPDTTLPPLAVDYSGRPLAEGATVAYISADPVRLCEGRVRAISPYNVCLEDGPHLITFTGRPASHSSTRPHPLGGAVSRDEDTPDPFLYSQIAVQPTTDGA